MKRLAIVLSIGITSLGVGFAQNGSPGASGKPDQTVQKPGSKDKVTTDDSVYNPAGGPGDKSGKAAADSGKKKQGDKASSKPETPPNPPIIDPHENPASPQNAPKEGNLPAKGNLPEKE